MEKILSHLFSMRTMALGMIVFLVAIARATFLESNYDIQTAKLLVYNALWFEILLIFLSINLIANIFRYRMFKRRKFAMFTFHLSFLVIILGAAVTRYIGYEGLMVIREGESSNFIYLADPHVWVRINDGKMQYTLQEKKFMSEITDNSFEMGPIAFPGKKQPISISYIDFKKKQIDSLLIDKKIDGDVLEIVTDGMKSSYLAPNGFVTVGNVPISYDKKNAAPGVHISSVNGDLMVISKLPMRYLPMSEMQKARQTGAEIPDSLYKNIPTDSLVPFYSTTLYIVENQQFVFRRQIQNAKLAKMSSGKKEVGLDLLTLKITDGNKSKIVTLEGGMNAMPTHEVFEFNGLTYEMEYGSTRREIPFSIACRDFQLDKYPGSETASSFASEVTILDEKNNYKRKQRIFMNNVMDYGGYRFFQSSYELDNPQTPENEEATKLSVNSDFWGTNITYFGYLLMALGMIFSLFASEGRFKDLLDKIVKSHKRRDSSLNILALVLLSAIGFSANAQDTIPHEHDHEDGHVHETAAPSKTKPALVHHFISDEHSEELASLLVEDFQGRIIPMHTLCDQLLRKVYGANKFKEHDAVQTVMSIHMYPEFWLTQEIISVPAAVREKLKLGKYATFISLYDESKGEFKWMADYNTAHQKLESRRNEFDKKLIKLVERFQVYSSFLNWDYLKIMPLKGAENNLWYSPFNNEFSQRDSSKFIETLQYLSALHEGSTENTWGKAGDMLVKLKKFQRETASADILPSDDHVKMEIRYNKMNIFKNCMYSYLVLGLILLILFFIRVFKTPTARSEKIFKRITLPFIVLMGFVFIYHALGLGMRWYISGHVPWSNGYEALLYIAWVAVLVGFCFLRKNPVVLAGTAILAFFIIFVTELNLLDPEITPLQPVLKSYWLMIHVAIITGSYAFLGLGAIFGFFNQLLYITRTSKNGQRITAHINEITYISELIITIGLFMLTIGTFLGGIWANESWGRYWGWDPKETWALVSVLVYAVILHLRYIPWLNGKFTFNFVSFWGYSAILFTFFGVNFYLVGLHSYAQGEGNPEVPGWILWTVIVFALFSLISYIRYRMYKSRAKSSKSIDMENKQIYDFEVLDIQGKVFDWNTVKGKKILLVNTASECGYTHHYGPLELMYKEYKDKNFTIIGFPCNDFGAQEPGSNLDVAEFCERNYGVTFPMMAKITILGEEAHPLYSWLKSETGTEVAWNFQKYLIDEKGNVVKMVAHRVEPDDKEIVDWIKS